MNKEDKRTLRRHYAAAQQDKKVQVTKMLVLLGHNEPMRSVLSEIFDDLLCIVATGVTRNLMSLAGARNGFDYSAFARNAFLRITEHVQGNDPIAVEAAALKIFKSVIKAASRAAYHGYPNGAIPRNSLDSVLVHHNATADKLKSKMALTSTDGVCTR